MPYILLIFFFVLTPLASFSEEFWQRNLLVHKVQNENTNSISLESPKVNLNHADAKRLQTLFGIGPRKAQAIIDYRRIHGSFQNLNDLSHIKGFNEHVLKKLVEKSGDLIEIK